METYDKIKKLREEDTRESKKQARNLVRGAFNVYLGNAYGRHQLAKYFLKYPQAALDGLLHTWTSFRASQDYQNQVQRSRAKDENDEEKMKAHSKKRYTDYERRSETCGDEGAN